MFACLNSAPSGGELRTDLEPLFNFAGHLPQANDNDKLLNWRGPGSCGVTLHNIADDLEPVSVLSMFSYVQDNRLHFSIGYNEKLAHLARIRSWIGAIERTLCQFAEELPTHASRLTVSDGPALDSAGDLDIDTVNQRLKELHIPASNVESIYPCSAVQEGILFALLKGQGDE